MTESIITALITGGLALIGVWISNRKSASLLEYRLQQVETKLDKHNHLVERMYDIEKRADVFENRMKVQEHRMEDLEKELISK